MTLDEPQMTVAPNSDTNAALGSLSMKNAMEVKAPAPTSSGRVACSLFSPVQATALYGVNVGEPGLQEPAQHDRGC